MMTLKELASLVEGVSAAAPLPDEVRVAGGYASDLLSDVMAHAKEGEVLITIQAHKNSVAVSGLVGAPAIVICNSRPVPDDMIQAAGEQGIALIVTGLNQYEVSGRLWNALRGAA
jgi:hypothetical protein